MNGVGVDGLVGESVGGGGSGKGFARLFWRLRLRACCAWSGFGDFMWIGDDMDGRSAVGMLDSAGRRRPSCEGWRVSLANSSRPGVIFLMPRKAEDKNSDGVLAGEREVCSSDSESEKRLRSKALGGCWSEVGDVSPKPAISAVAAPAAQNYLCKKALDSETGDKTWA